MSRVALWIIVVLAVALPAPLALAKRLPPELRDSRYVLAEVEEGFLRLDTRTGQVSLCRPRRGGWTCQIAPDDRAALEQQISRLRADVAALKQSIEQGAKAPPTLKRESGTDRPAEPAGSKNIVENEPPKQTAAPSLDAARYASQTGDPPAKAAVDPETIRIGPPAVASGAPEPPAVVATGSIAVAPPTSADTKVDAPPREPAGWIVTALQRAWQRLVDIMSNLQKKT